MRRVKVDRGTPLAHHYSTHLPLLAKSSGFSVWTHDAHCDRGEEETQLYAVEIVLAGDLAFTQRGTNYISKAGDVNLLQPGTANYYTTGPSNYTLKRHVLLGGSEIARLWQSLGLDGHDVVRPHHPHVVQTHMRHIAYLNRHKPPGYIRQNAATSYALLLSLGVQAGPSIPDEIQSVIDYINRHLGRASMTTETLAKQVTLSVPHFNRLFRKHVGQSPRHFIQDQRIALSQTLLRETSMSISQVSEHCGYSDALYFSTRFKKKTGQSPRDFRRQHQW